MLIVVRRVGQGIIIRDETGEWVAVKVLRTNGNRVRLGIISTEGRKVEFMGSADCLPDEEGEEWVADPFSAS